MDFITPGGTNRPVGAVGIGEEELEAGLKDDDASACFLDLLVVDFMVVLGFVWGCMEMEIVRDRTGRQIYRRTMQARQSD